MQLAYPSNLGLATSGLALAACEPSALELLGVDACPADSRMGSGAALVEIPIDSDVVMEKAQLALFAGPSPDGHLHVLVYVAGTSPVQAYVILRGELVAQRLNIAVPSIPTLPGASDVILTRMQLTLGGRLTYYERVHGTTLAYNPPGIGLPDRCPAGGFPFAATFAFADGSQASASTAVPCPRR